MLFLGGTVAGATGLVLALPLFGVVAVIGQAVAEVISDHKLRARFREGRRLAALSAKREAMKSA
jgi:predicted PurR-regulated permease PerM